MSILPLYFDPGTGALVAQAVAAVGAGVLLFYKRIKYGIQSFFGKKKDDSLMGDIDIEESKDGGDSK
ncbi:hypothetical protein OGH69_05445 [Flavobacterium sp. MFBS3-15]|uniref:hypothetical protein n=1 Tax=Flavobacterium sp. MFBS3-15 TaxID=2989816 RepID=UPI00223654C0|nr:hypothetical protein [Flavobacterium sp. MFBS3-15]MCW4468400.1 hypothetical protein [Flavobacterium sp. MFBS3-15]